MRSGRDGGQVWRALESPAAGQRCLRRGNGGRGQRGRGRDGVLRPSRAPRDFHPIHQGTAVPRSRGHKSLIAMELVGRVGFALKKERDPPDWTVIGR